MKPFEFNAHDEYGNRKQILVHAYSLVDAMKKAQHKANKDKLTLIY